MTEYGKDLMLMFMLPIIFFYIGTMWANAGRDEE